MDPRRNPSIAEWFHEETKYSPQSMGLLPRPDVDQRPLPYKEWHASEPVDLVPYLPFPGFPLGPSEDQRPLDSALLSEFVGALSRILYFTGGVTGIQQSPEESWLFRAAPSAGALYPTDITLALRGIRGIEDGLHAYSVPNHQLVSVLEGDFLPGIASSFWDHPSFDGVQAVVLLSGVWQRSRWRYHDRAYRRILLDTGHVLGNLVHAAQQEGLQAIPLAGFDDPALQKLMFLDSEQEGVLVGVPLRRADDVSTAADGLVAAVKRSSRSTAPPDFETDPILAIHESSSMIHDAEVALPPDPPTWAEGAADARVVPLVETLGDISNEFPRIVVRRRSTRQFTGASVNRRDLDRVLDFAHRYATPGPVRYLSARPALQIHLVVNRVKGLEPGVWRYLPDEHQLRLIRSGDERRRVHGACLGQELARDAACLVVYSADLPHAVEVWGDRAYRYLHLDAGFLGQQLNLACIHQELGVSGVAGFFDDTWNEILELPADHAITYITAIGDPFASE
ncbi:MAG: SagB/ThcOx family dehydrogenase [Planctomycetota bacterium]|nr:SagB/ThcOx family dehydrogenase [Planctomycetota bacterium]